MTMYHRPAALSETSAILGHVNIVNDSGYGFNPRNIDMLDAEGRLIERDGTEPPPPEVQGPPDPLKTLRDELDAMEAAALGVLYARRRDVPSFGTASHKTIGRLNAIVEELAAALVGRVREYHRPALVSVPEGVLLALPELLPAIRPAQRAVTLLTEARRNAHQRLIDAE